MEDIAYVWSALGGDPALTSRVSAVERPGALDARLPVRRTARACVAACALAAAELAAARAGSGPVPAVRVDDGAVAAAFTGERLLRVDGREPVAFAPLSRLWRTADGRLRTHANYPHHRERLLRVLDVGPASDPDAVAAALAGRSALDVEEAVSAAGGLAVALRTPDRWAASAQGAAVARLPLVERGTPDTAPAPVTLPGSSPSQPAAGVRVLDLTRVLAGPVATRTLALLGADVLRLEPPGLPELADLHAETGFGKRSAVLDLGADRDVFEELLAAADVVVTGYRPGALDRFGLSPRALAERRPGLVVARLTAWGPDGPWAGRRGFDSLVQVATGIAHVEGVAGRPGGAAGAGPGPRLGLPAGGGCAAGADRADARGREPDGAGVAGADGGLAAGRRLGGRHGGRERAPVRGGCRGRGHAPVRGWCVHRATAVARRAGQPARTAAVRPARGLLHGRPHGLAPATGPGGSGRGGVGVGGCRRRWGGASVGASGSRRAVSVGGVGVAAGGLGRGRRGRGGGRSRWSRWVGRNEVAGVAGRPHVAGGGGDRGRGCGRKPSPWAE